MKILITGAAGFIGRHVAALLRQTHDVTGVDCLIEQVHQGKRELPPWIEEDTVLRWATTRALKKQPSDYDAVIHLAAHVGVGQSMYQPHEYVHLNSASTIALLEWLAMPGTKPCRLIVASSMSVYGEGEYRIGGYSWSHGGLTRAVERGWDAFDLAHGMATATRIDKATPLITRETKPAEPASVYAMTKYDQEQYSLMLGRAYGHQVVALRFFNTYGPGQALGNPYTGALAIFCTRVLNNRAPVVYEDGEQLRDFIHVRDVAKAVVAAVETPTVDGVYNICTGAGTSVKQLAEMVCEAAESFGVAGVAPHITGAYRAGDVRACVGDPVRFQAATDWEAEENLAAGVRETLLWAQTAPLPTDLTDKAREELAEQGLESVPHTRI